MSAQARAVKVRHAVRSRGNAAIATLRDLDHELEPMEQIEFADVIVKMKQLAQLLELQIKQVEAQICEQSTHP